MALGRDFYKKLDKISAEVGMNPRDLLLVMYSESGLQSSIVNKDKINGGAVGLIQFMPDTLKGLGVPKSEIKDFGNKPAEDQLDYVKKYIKGQMSFVGRPFKSASEYYHANFFPKTLKRWIGSDPIENANTIVVSRNSKDGVERAAYNANKSLDSNNDGIITVGDMTAVLMNNANKNGFQQALSQFNSVSGSGSVSEIDKDPTLLKKPFKPTEYAKQQNIPQFNPTSQPSRLDSFLSNINKLLSSVFKLSKEKNDDNLLVIVGANDLETKIEFARILQSVLNEELKSSATIHKLGQNIEINCNLPFNSENNEKSLTEICNAVSDTFKYATNKIGGCKANTTIINKTSSDYQEIDIKIAELNRRKFKYKFALRK